MGRRPKTTSPENGEGADDTADMQNTADAQNTAGDNKETAGTLLDAPTTGDTEVTTGTQEVPEQSDVTPSDPDVTPSDPDLDPEQVGAEKEKGEDEGGASTAVIVIGREVTGYVLMPSLDDLGVSVSEDARDVVGSVLFAMYCKGLQVTDVIEPKYATDIIPYAFDPGVIQALVGLPLNQALGYAANFGSGGLAVSQDYVVVGVADVGCARYYTPEGEVVPLGRVTPANVGGRNIWIVEPSIGVGVPL